MTEEKVKMNKKKMTITILAVLAVSLVVLLVVLYMWKVNYYKTHFLPNTFINGVSCGEMDVVAAAEILKSDVQAYTLSVLGRDENGSQVELGTILAEQIDLQIADAAAEAGMALSQQNAGGWLIAAITGQEQHLNVVHNVIFDENLIETCVMEFPAFKEENMIAPADAYISEYKEELNGCVIVPEVLGTQLDTDVAISCIKAAIAAGGKTVDLAEQGCYAAPAVCAADQTLIDTWRIVNKWLGTKVTYDWNTFEVVVDGSVIQDWIVTEDGAAKLDEEAVAAFVAEKAAKYDTYGKSRKFTTTLGVELTLPTGGFGWKTDRDAVTKNLLELVEAGSVTKAEPEYSNKAPWKGMNDIGNSYVEADLSNQHLYLYNKGQLVFETDFVSGAMNSTPDCITPVGVFDITYKTTNAVLRGSDYETPVSYWMPFYGNYGMHDATWRWQFGGSIFMTDGSHGCLNLPLDSAAVIYNYMYEGYPVICYYY